MANTNTYQAQANELSQKLWAIANELRGQMDASEFKNYILGVIFYRYLSERTEMYMAEILENDGVTYEEAFADDDYRSVVEEWSLTKLGYVIRPENLFRNLIRKITKFESEADRFSVEDFEKAINDLVGSTMGHESNKAFDGLFNDMRLKDARLGESVADRTDMIGRVMVKVSDIDFDLQDSQFDVLGTAYMILIGLFASDAGKKGGEFFTPAGPSRLCATLASLGLDEAKTVGDCTCGSASMLLEVQKHLTTHKVGHFYGQELNATTYNLSRMNMIMHGVDWQNFDIYKGDTLKDDKYGYDLRLTVQVCNPPYSLKWSADKKFEDDPRYRGVGKLAPKSAADLAFVEHMIYHMDETDGRVAVLLPHGVLFRGGAEEAIRKYIIKDLKKEEILLIMPPEHPLAAAGSVSTHGIYPKLDLSLLAEEPFILHFPEQTTGQLSLEALKAAHIKPYVPIQSRNTETCVKLCMQGLGMCFTPETYVQNMDLPVKPACFSIGEDGVFSTLTIAYRRGTYLPQYARDFICTAKKVL